MRKIEFRGQAIDDKEWEYGFYSKVNDNHGMKDVIITGADRGCSIPKFVIPETVGQYTGLTDKNGKEIYEGDILQVSKEYSGTFTPIIVGYEKTHFTAQIAHKLRPACPFDNIFDKDAHIIIGNIYDNPKLLEE